MTLSEKLRARKEAPRAHQQGCCVVLEQFGTELTKLCPPSYVVRQRSERVVVEDQDYCPIISWELITNNKGVFLVIETWASVWDSSVTVDRVEVLVASCDQLEDYLVNTIPSTLL